MPNFARMERIAKALKPHHQNGKSFHVSFGYHGSKLLAIGINDYSKAHRSHIFGEYKANKRGSKYQSGIHSEISMLLKLGLEDCSHLTVVNIRIDNNGNPAISKPCVNCQAVLDQVSYKALWFHDGESYIKN
jgi:hypothetical protein